MAIEEPSFTVLINEPPHQLRRYSGFIVAETEVQGDFDSASRAGFRKVAKYIFGGNRSNDGSSRKIPMTAPVTVEQLSDSWRLHFVMPKSESIDRLPTPLQSDVKLRPVNEHVVAVVTFSGFTTHRSIHLASLDLNNWMNSKQLQAIGSAQIARYNDPFTMPWKRRNEIMIPTSIALPTIQN